MIDIEVVEIKIVRIILFFPLDQTSFLRKQNSNTTIFQTFEILNCIENEY